MNSEHVWPGARYREVTTLRTDPRLDVVAGVIWHIAATEASSLFHWFDGPSGGIESHLYIPRTPEDQIEQYRPCNHEADANYKGNSWIQSGKRHGFLSIEFQGADPNTGLWTPYQVEKGLEFTEWAHDKYGFARRVAPGYRSQGIGYHTMFGSGGGTNSWSSAAGKTCPGVKRISQFYDVVLPRFLGAEVPQKPQPKPVVTMTAPRFPLPSGYYFGPKSGPKESISGYYSHRAVLRMWQARMDVRGWRITVDGVYGPRTAEVARAFQKQCKLKQDGLIGPATWAAAWTQPVT